MVSIVTGAINTRYHTDGLPPLQCLLCTQKRESPIVLGNDKDSRGGSWLVHVWSDTEKCRWRNSGRPWCGKRQSNPYRTDISIHGKTFQWRWRHFGATNVAYKASHASCPVSRTPVALLQSAKASHVVNKQQPLECFIFFLHLRRVISE